MALGDAYVSVDETRDYCQIEDSIDDLLIAQFVAGAASRAVEAYCRRQFNKETVASARRFRPVDWRKLPVDDFHTTTGLLVDGVAWSAADHDPQPLNGFVNGQSGWPYYDLYAVATPWTWSQIDGTTPVTVTAQWGWPAVPEDVRYATLIEAARLFRRRFSPSGLQSVGGGDFVFRVSTITDPDVQQLLDPYRLRRLVVA